MNQIVPVILCGGSGTRLWPRSRKTRPKPFLPLIGERTMFEATLGRCADAAQFAPPVVVTGKDHLEHVEDQAKIAPGATVIVEPEAKNTAAAIALAAARLPQGAVMLVCPSDHHIADEQAFRDAAASAARLAAEDWLVSFGIAATAPETGYGYIRRGEPLDGGYRVERFVEKPDLERARQFLAELARHRPALAAAARKAIESGRQDAKRFHPDAAAFAAIVPITPRREDSQSPLKEAMHDLHPYVAYLVLPLFAFAKSGVSFAGLSIEAALTPLMLGIAAGLFVGKQLGVFGFAWLASALKIGKRPTDATWAQLYGVSMLCGIGFTMSLFIGVLAFPGAVDSPEQVQIKLGVLLGSFLSAVVGVLLLSVAGRTQPAANAQGAPEQDPRNLDEY